MVEKLPSNGEAMGLNPRDMNIYTTEYVWYSKIKEDSSEKSKLKMYWD